jgi:hypothetical protein
MSLPEEQVYDPLEIAYHEINQLNRENAQLRKEREELIKSIWDEINSPYPSDMCLSKIEDILAKLEGGK